MATALFISRTDLVRNSILSGGIDTDKFIQFIKLGQEIDIQNLLGTDLYNRISDDITNNTLTGDYLALVSDYIQSTLIWFAQVNYIPFAAYQIKNGGVFKHSSETAENVSKEEVDYLVAKAREYARYLLIQYGFIKAVRGAIISGLERLIKLKTVKKAR